MVGGLSLNTRRQRSLGTYGELTMRSPVGGGGVGSSLNHESPSSYGSGNGLGSWDLGLGNSSSGSSLPSGSNIIARLLQTAKRRSALRNVGGTGMAILLLWLLLVFLGVFDPDLRIGGHIDPRTFQVYPAGDPRKRGEIPYEKPPGYWEFLAQWNAPNFELLANPGPSTRTCDKAGPLLFIGLFSTAKSVGRRQIIRTVFKPDLHPEGQKIAFKFIVGKPDDADWRYQLDQENHFYDDIVILEEVEKDNIDDGKSIEYLKWLVKEYPNPKPQFVLKMDDDAFLVMPNVIRNLASLDCKEAIYWGTTQGANLDFFGKYMRGLCYGLSWPVVSWIGTANISSTYAAGVEDAKIGRIIKTLDPEKEPVQWIDWGWKMGDWDQLKVDETIVGFHWLKLDHWVPMVKRKALKAWADAGRPYRWDYDTVAARSPIQEGAKEP